MYKRYRSRYLHVVVISEAFVVLLQVGEDLNLMADQLQEPFVFAQVFAPLHINEHLLHVVLLIGPFWVPTV
jgi:hypothetical protein